MMDPIKFISIFIHVRVEIAPKIVISGSLIWLQIVNNYSKHRGSRNISSYSKKWTTVFTFPSEI